MVNFWTEVEYATRPSFQLLQHSLAMHFKSGPVNKLALHMQGCCLWKALHIFTDYWTAMQTQISSQGLSAGGNSINSGGTAHAVIARCT